ncbi:MAG: hypothetical protein NWF00_03765 [Candidatus Bathyarchaeota archaeon]|nr:hypothetical protein [Candidatus Bathyarchaeota archaeon]
MNLREREREIEIGRIVKRLSEQTRGFEKPKMVLIGGYALRAFTTFSRYTRDCDFVLRSLKTGTWTGFEISVQGYERGYLRETGHPWIHEVHKAAWRRRKDINRFHGGRGAWKDR